METLQVEILESLKDHVDFNGWGFLGTDHSEESERTLVDFANKLGWDTQDLLLFCDSKPGRWFADDSLSKSGDVLLDSLRVNVALFLAHREA